MDSIQSIVWGDGWSTTPKWHCFWLNLMIWWSSFEPSSRGHLETFSWISHQNAQSWRQSESDTPSWIPCIPRHVYHDLLTIAPYSSFLRWNLDLAIYIVLVIGMYNRKVYQLSKNHYFELPTPKPEPCPSHAFTAACRNWTAWRPYESQSDWVAVSGAVPPGILGTWSSNIRNEAAQHVKKHPDRSSNHKYKE